VCYVYVPCTSPFSPSRLPVPSLYRCSLPVDSQFPHCALPILSLLTLNSLTLCSLSVDSLVIVLSAITSHLRLARVSPPVCSVVVIVVSAMTIREAVVLTDSLDTSPSPPGWSCVCAAIACCFAMYSCDWSGGEGLAARRAHGIFMSSMQTEETRLN